MTNYLLIYRADPAAMAAMPEPTPEQAAQMMDAWNGWAARAGDAIVDFGDPTAGSPPVPTRRSAASPCCKPTPTMRSPHCSTVTRTSRWAGRSTSTSGSP